MIQLTTTISPIEYIDYSVDFSALLPTGVTLDGTPILSAYMLIGQDVATNVLSGDATVVGSKVMVPLKGSLDWHDYVIQVSCGTSNEDIVVYANIILQCRSLVSFIKNVSIG